MSNSRGSFNNWNAWYLKKVDALIEYFDDLNDREELDGYIHAEDVKYEVFDILGIREHDE